METSYRKTSRDTLIIGATTVAQFVIGMAQLPLLTKFLSVQDYGIWSQIWATISLLAPFVNLGLGAALIRHLASEKDREEIKEGFYSVILVFFAINLMAALIMLAFAEPIARNFFDGAVQIVRLTSILILLTPLGLTYLLLTRAFQQIKAYTAFMFTDDVLRVGLLAFVVLNGYGIFSVVIVLIATKAVILVALFFRVKSQIGIKWPRFSRIKEYLRFGLPLTPRGIGFWLVNLSDRYVIGYFMGAASVGIYSAGSALGAFPDMFFAILTFTQLATLPKLYDEGKMDEVKTHLRYLLKYFLVLAIPFIFGTALLGEQVLRIFSTREIASLGYLVVPVIALATFFLCIHHVVSNILFLVKKTTMMAAVWIVAAALNIGLNILVVPIMGIIGAAITTLITYALALGVLGYYAFKEFRFTIDWYFIIKSLIASAIMSVAVWLMAPEGYLDTIITVVAGVAIYVVILVLLRGFSNEEFSFFWGLLRPGKRPK